MTNANFTFLIFFHKTPLSKGRLGYQSPFPFCKAVTANLISFIGEKSIKSLNMLSNPIPMLVGLVLI